MNGIFLANPLGLWALGAVAAVAVLYLFYRRFRPLPVTGLFLWGVPRREGAGGRSLEKPLTGRSFILDVLAAALFALALSGPAYRTDSGLPVVVILDDCFAMRARDAHVEAGRLAGGILRASPGDGVPTAIMLAGDQPRVWRGLGARTRSETADALADYLPDREAGDIQAAVAMAQNLYGSQLAIQVITNQDIAPTAAPGGILTTHILPGKGGNLALSGSWREVAGAAHRERLVLAVRNFSDDAVSARLTVRADGSETVLHTETLELAAGETRMPEVVMAFSNDQTLVATVTAEMDADVIADDSRAFLPPVSRRAANYLVEGQTPAVERYFSMALEAAGCRPAPWESEGLPPPDILVTGDKERRGGVVTLEVPPVTDPGVFSPPYVVDTTKALCRDLDLSAVPWVVANRETPEDVREVFVAAGGMPLYWRGASGRLHLNLVPDRSGMVNDPAWPVLVANLAEAAVAGLPGLGKTAYAPGAPICYVRGADAPAGPPTLFAGDKQVGVLRSADTLAPRNPGRYRIRAGATDIGEIAVIPAFGDGSDTTGLAAVQRTLVSGGADDGGGALDLTWAALLAGLALLGMNFWLGAHTGRGE